MLPSLDAHFGTFEIPGGPFVDQTRDGISSPIKVRRALNGHAARGQRHIRRSAPAWWRARWVILNLQRPSYAAAAGAAIRIDEARAGAHNCPTLAEPRPEDGPILT